MPCIFAMIAKFTMHSEIHPPCVLFPNDFVLYNSHFVPIVIIYFRCFWYFTHLVWLYKPTYSFCNPNFSFKLSFMQLLFLGYSFSLFSLFFLSFSWLPNTTFEDDNSRDVWLKPPFLEEEGHWWRFEGKFSCPFIYHTAFMSI